MATLREQNHQSVSNTNPIIFFYGTISQILNRIYLDMKMGFSSSLSMIDWLSSARHYVGPVRQARLMGFSLGLQYRPHAPYMPSKSEVLVGKNIIAISKCTNLASALCASKSSLTGRGRVARMCNQRRNAALDVCSLYMRKTEPILPRWVPNSKFSWASLHSGNYCWKRWLV
jgi:hypothetical protein